MTKKKYKIIPTQKQLEILKLYWKMYECEHNDFWGRICKLEEGMSKKTGIENLEFFWCDNEIVGIGDRDRGMKLIQREALE